MCSYCGCDAIDPIGRFMAEHAEIINATGRLRRAVASTDRAAVGQAAADVAALLHPHTRAEEDGLFSVMREQPEFTEHIDVLCGEHTDLDALLEAVAGGAHGRMAEFEKALRMHIDKEDNGLFPAAAVSLDGPDWDRVDAQTPPAPPHTHPADHPHPHPHSHGEDAADTPGSLPRLPIQ